MKKFKKIYWTGYKSITHEQKYFVYRWLELLNLNQMDYESLPVYGVRGHLREFLSVYTLVLSGTFDIIHIIDVIHDLQFTLKNNFVIRTKYFSHEKEVLDKKFKDFLDAYEKRKENNNFHYKILTEINLLISSFVKKLDCSSFIDNHINILCELFARPKVVMPPIVKTQI